MTVTNKTVPQEYQNIEDLIDKINHEMPPLFRLKERGRLVLGEFVNSNIFSYNKKDQQFKEYQLTYSLDFFGSLQGKIFLNIEPDIAVHITKLLFGDDLDDPISLVNEAMKETLNIFSGHLVAFLHEFNHDLDIGVPSPVKHNFLESKCRKKILFRFLSNDHVLQFLMEIH
ncbi:MAG: chemotaxis protein CheX [Spirochaetia bacterium]|nr:chemotaxis protein CheX [Spirochaetia bacterium]